MIVRHVCDECGVVPCGEVDTVPGPPPFDTVPGPPPFDTVPGPPPYLVHRTGPLGLICNEVREEHVSEALARWEHLYGEALL